MCKTRAYLKGGGEGRGEEERGGGWVGCFYSGPRWEKKGLTDGSQEVRTRMKGGVASR